MRKTPSVSLWPPRPCVAHTQRFMCMSTSPQTYTHTSDWAAAEREHTLREANPTWSWWGTKADEPRGACTGQLGRILLGPERPWVWLRL